MKLSAGLLVFMETYYEELGSNNRGAGRRRKRPRRDVFEGETG